MPNVLPAIQRFFLLLSIVAFPLAGRAQQPDSAAARDSARRDSVAKADSIRGDALMRNELARIRAERAQTSPTSEPALPDDSVGQKSGVMVTAGSVAADMITDFSARAAARGPGRRIRLRDIEGAIGVSYGTRVRGIVAMTLIDDGATQRLRGTDAALIVKLPAALAGADLVVGRTAFPFGRSAQLHRHELPFPDQPLPVRVLLGEDGLRGTGAQIRGGRAMRRAWVSLDLAVADGFGTPVDSLRPGEPADQSLAGVTAGGRLGARFGALGSRLDVGVSSVSGKREQPIGCVYEGTVGPVPCPEAVNAANTRLTVLGADARAGWGPGGEAFVISGEWMRMIVGRTDLPAFSNDRFTPFYSGLTGTYDGGYLGAHVRLTRGLMIGARGDWLQNPEVRGLNDLWVGGYVGMAPFPGARVTASYQRRNPSATALVAMTRAEQAARDRLVLRGTVVLGRHPRLERD